MDIDKIEQSIIDILKEVGYDVADEQEVDIIDIAKSLGFVVGNCILNDEDNGFIIVDERKNEIFGIKTNKLIGVNSDRSLGWKRFIIARMLKLYTLEYKEKNISGLYAHIDRGT